ncbi:MAG: UDP binding domain-containing protein, partial [Blastocatellia bacterium]
IGGHCLTGAETAIIRMMNGSKERVEQLSRLFIEQYADDTNTTFEFENGHVVQNPRFEALSINPETHQPEWKPVSYLFRRAYQGKLVTIITSDNRRLTVTDEHPMLVCDAAGQLRQIFAKDVAIGDRLPIHFRAAGDLPQLSDSMDDPEIDLLPLLPREMKDRIRLRIIGGSWRGYRATLKKRLMTVPVKSVEIHETEQPIEVYSLEVEDNHTFTTSYGIYVHNCIPLDPHYLSWKARMHGFEARFISLAEEVNSRMPDHVVELVTRGLNKHRKAVNGSKVLIMGVAYKRDIDDMRESPALGIIEKLQDLGADVKFHDPYVEEVHLEGIGQIVKGTPLTAELVRDSDCVVIVTDHRKVDYDWVCDLAKLVVDTRNATRGLSDGRFEGKIIRL